MFEYLCPVSVRVLDMYITGYPSCSNTAISPCLEVSHCVVCSDFASKYAKTGSILTKLYSIPSNAILCFSCKVCLIVVWSDFASKYVKIGSKLIILFIPSNALWCSESHLHNVFLVKSVYHPK